MRMTHTNTSKRAMVDFRLRAYIVFSSMLLSSITPGLWSGWVLNPASLPLYGID